MDPTNRRVPILHSALNLNPKSVNLSQTLPVQTRFPFPSIQSQKTASKFSTIPISSLNLPNHVAVLPPFAKRFYSDQPPRMTANGINNPTPSVASLKSATDSSSSQPRGFAAFKARPFLHTLVFGVTHVSICWALVPLVYFGLSSTGTSNALLGGPQVAYLLSRPVPNWLPGVESLNEPSPENTGRKSKKDKPKTVEDLLDSVLRSSIKFGWSSGGALLSSLKSTSKSLSENKDFKDLTKLLKDKANESDGHTGEEDRLVSATMKELKGENGSNELKSKPFYRKMFDDGLDSIGGKARKSASEIHIGNIRDAVGAWVLVKVLFPVRLPISLFLTPKVARFLTKGFAKST